MARREQDLARPQFEVLKAEFPSLGDGFPYLLAGFAALQDIGPYLPLVIPCGAEHLAPLRRGRFYTALPYFAIASHTAMPYISDMHTIVSTAMYEAQAKRAGMSQDEREAIEVLLSEDPLAGDIMAGTGGARKLRHIGKGKGKSGGYRTIHYYGGDDVPVFLLAVFSKGDAANLTKSQRNDLAKILPTIAETYRKNAKSLAAKLANKNRKGTSK